MGFHRFAHRAVLPLALCWSLAGCDPDVAPSSTRQKLVVSQLLYRGLSDSLEWIEIRNDGDSPARLGGVEIKGIGFEFPDSVGVLDPGGKTVLTNSEALFARRHPGVRIGGVYSGRLADEGETVRIVDAGDELFRVSYSTSEPWPVGAGRFGRSLVFLGGDPEDPRSWGASRNPGGEPMGTPAQARDKGVWISEIRPADDSGRGFIELASVSSEDVDVSGWILAPEHGGSRYDTVPAGTSVPAGGRIVFWQTPGSGQLGWGRQLPKPTEDEVYLIEAEDGEITGAGHSLSWSYVPRGMSVGRVGRFADGGAPVLIGTPTPGAGDQARFRGEVSIAEVCYSPVEGGAEFVELENETDSVVHLGGSVDVPVSWRLAGAGKIFSGTDSIAARGKIVLVSEADATVDEFRARWGIGDDVAVIGFPGRLDDAGETLELLRPDARVAGKSGPVWLERVVDAARWGGGAPWSASTAAGGDCLARIDKDASGTSFAAWTSSKPTPGK